MLGPFDQGFVGLNHLYSFMHTYTKYIHFPPIKIIFGYCKSQPTYSSSSLLSSLIFSTFIFFSTVLSMFLCLHTRTPICKSVMLPCTYSLKAELEIPQVSASFIPSVSNARMLAIFINALPSNSLRFYLGFSGWNVSCLRYESLCTHRYLRNISLFGHS